MAFTYLVKQGDTMAIIAKQHQFFDWRTIYLAPENAPLRRLRPDPNLLFPKDQVIIQDKQPKQEEAETGKRHVFHVGGMRYEIRIVLKDVRGQPLSGAPYELTIDGGSVPGTTDANGLLRAEIPIVAQTLTLKVRGYGWDLDVGELNPMPQTKDNGVSGAQGRLRNLGYDVGLIDGKLGPKTRAALRLFQQRQGIAPADGGLTPDTEQALAKEHGC